MQAAQIPTERFSRNEAFHSSANANPSGIGVNRTRVKTAMNFGKSKRFWIVHPDLAAFNFLHETFRFDSAPSSSRDDILIAIQDRNEAALGLVTKTRIEGAGDSGSFRHTQRAPSLHVITNNIGEAIL